MKATVISGVDQVEVTTIADPQPAPDEVVVEVAGCGLCGTDLHILRGEFAPTLPVVPGHEFAGTVVAVGTGVDSLAPGARVAVDPSLYCYRCHSCRAGRNNLCENWGAIGVTTAGGAAEYVAVPAANCLPVPADIRLADAALIEPLSCAIHGYDILAAQLGAHVLIYGAGTMGLMLLQLAKRVGAATVDVVDVNAQRLGVARRVGCSAATTNAEELDRARGWELVIDATGNPTAIQDGLGRVAPGGTFLQFGMADYATKVSVEPYRIYRQEITITGSMAVLRSYDRAAELFASGILDPDLFITHRYPLEKYRDALDAFTSGQGLKIQVLPHDVN